MKCNVFSNGSTTILIVATGLAWAVNGGLQTHSHQHGSLLGRLVHHPKAGSGSGSLGGVPYGGKFSIAISATQTY